MFSSEFLDVEFAPANCDEHSESNDESSDPVSEVPHGMGGIPRQPCKFPTPTFWSQEDKRWIESAPPVIPADAVGRIVLFSSWESGHRGNKSTGKSLYEMSVKKGRSELAKCNGTGCLVPKLPQGRTKDLGTNIATMLLVVKLPQGPCGNIVAILVPILPQG